MRSLTPHSAPSLVASVPRATLPYYLLILWSQRFAALLPLFTVRLQARKWESHYPLFTTIHRIVNGHVPPSMIVDYVAASRMDISATSEEDDEIVPTRRPPTAAKAAAKAPAPVQQQQQVQVQQQQRQLAGSARA